MPTRLLLLLLISFSAFAQAPTKRISGLVKDHRNEPVPGATVRLLRADDSTLVSGKVTNLDGKFEFNEPVSNTYRLRVTAVGHNDYLSGAFTVDESHPVVLLPVILLTPSKTVLNEVAVVAKRPLIEQDIDKTVVNVDAMIGSAGSNVLEVLEKTPGVTVGTDGEISLNGKAGVTVLLDGRPTYLSGSDLAAYLKSLPGGSLDRVELMSNPPARYDAAGNAIINLRLKRNRVRGLTGSLSAGFSQGVTFRSNDFLQLNYNRRRMNLFASLAYNRDATYSEDFYERRFYTAGSFLSSSLHLQPDYRYRSRGVTARMGMDYAASLRTTYGFVVVWQNRPKWDRLDHTSRYYNARPELDSLGTGYTDGRYQWAQREANVNFQHKFNESGQELTMDLNYIRYGGRGKQTLEMFSRRPDGRLLSRSPFLYDLPSAITIYSAKADYTHPLGNKARLETGIKSSVVTNDNDSRYFIRTDSIDTPDYRKSNHFYYRETIHAAYVNGRKEWSRWAVQLGLRWEQTVAVGRQRGNSEVAGVAFNRTFAGFFPTAFFSYKLDSAGHNTLTASLARRLNRPNYQLLNPFVFYQDQNTFSAGNPLLKPQYSYRYELRYQHKQYFGLGLQYNRFTDVIFRMTEVVDPIFYTRPGNVARGSILALIGNLSLSPRPWWVVTTTVTAAHMALRGEAYSVPLALSTYHARVGMFHQFRFKKGWNAEISGDYGTRDLSGQTFTAPRYRIAAAAQKKVLKDRGSIRLTLEDILHSWKTRTTTVSLKGAVSYQTNEIDTRRIGLAFTYRFGKETPGRKRRNSDNAAEAEKGRIE